MRREQAQLPILLTTEEVATLLGVSRSLVYHLVDKGKLPHHRVGLGRGTIRFTEKDVSEFLRSCRNETREERKSSVKRARRGELRHLKA